MTPWLQVACAASCGPGQWLCGEGRCVEAVLLCDGTRDCGLGEDEDPDLCSCGEAKLRCEAGGCVEAGARCDGRGQCPDRSDEWNCVDINSTLSVRLVSENIDEIVKPLPKPLVLKRNTLGPTTTQSNPFQNPNYFQGY